MLLVAGAAAGCLVLPLQVGAVHAAPGGCSPDGPCVSIHEFSGGTDHDVRDVTGSELDALADHAHTTCYDVRATPSQPSTCHNVSNALSIHALLEGTPDPNATGESLADTATFTATPRANGSWSVLSHPELQADTSGTFENGLLPVVHSIGDATDGPIEYVRPLTTNSDDTNAQDIFTLGESSTLTIDVFTGPLLDVKIATNPKHLRVGKAVQFTETASDSDNGNPVSASSLSYSWSFGDGGTATTQTPTYRFKAAGTWLVQLTATGTSDGSGGMATLAVTAGPPPKKTSPSPSPGTGTSPSPSPSPSPNPGPVSTTTPNPGLSPSSHPGNRHRGGGQQFPTLDNGAVSRLFSRLSGQGSGQQPQVASGSGAVQLVSGQVIAGGAPLSLSQAASESSALATAPAAGAAARWSPGTVPIYVGAFLLLLGLGIARERGWLTLRRR